MWFCQVFRFLYPSLCGRTGGGVDADTISCVPGVGCDTVSIGWIGVNTICCVGVGLGGSSYHTGIPKVNPTRLSISMTILITIPEGGKRKGIMCTGNEPQ